MYAQTFNAHAIVGAIEGPIPTDHPASFNTVALVKPQGINGGYKIFCTGVILSKKYILTAKHCLGDRNISNFKIYFGPNTNAINPELLRVPDKMSVYGSSDWENYFPSFDVAWVRLKQEIPNHDGANKSLPHFRPVPFLADSQPLTSSTPVHLAGYGNTSTQLLEVISGEKKHVATSFKKYIDTAQVASILVFEGEKGHSNCHGDSGGPAYAKTTDNLGNTRWHLIGTASGFDIALTPKSYKKIDGDEEFPHVALCDRAQTLYTFAGDYLGWIQQETGLHIEQTGIAKSKLPGVTKKANTPPTTFAQWCEQADLNSDQWLTIRQTLIFAMEQTKTEFTTEDIFIDCEVAEQALASLERLRFDKDSLFSDLAPLATLTHLKSLAFDEPATLPDLKPLSQSSITKLRLHKIQADNLSDIPGLLNMTHLEGLEVSSSQLADIDDVVLFPNLTYVNFSMNKIENVSPLSELTNLIEVDLFSNNITDLEPLLDLEELAALTLSNNQITSPESLANWPKLTKLIISHNELTNLNFVEKSLLLERVIVANNDIASLEPLEGKPIRVLRTYGNELLEDQENVD